MHHPDDAPTLAELIPRYVTPGRRYLRLGGGLLRTQVTDRAAFLRELAEAARQITDTELEVLLDDGGWRERWTAAWFIAVTDRNQFRDKLGSLLLASEGPRAGRAYCMALTCLGTDADATHLIAYLDRYLLRPDLNYDQPEALGALLCLDEALGTGHATRFVEPDGLWWQFRRRATPQGLDTVTARRTVVHQQMCALARESARSGSLDDRHDHH
ncbi:DUF6000 family protein [Amycolatopsis sp. NPDC051061]|uniref:DUF6000 family protein n=1 Tax=Amycolatopsis sp. NPDC051061 TaxID=3155042 RepID=UPI0034341F87